MTLVQSEVGVGLAIRCFRYKQTYPAHITIINCIKHSYYRLCKADTLSTSKSEDKSFCYEVQIAVCGHPSQIPVYDKIKSDTRILKMDLSEL